MIQKILHLTCRMVIRSTEPYGRLFYRNKRIFFSQINIEIYNNMTVLYPTVPVLPLLIRKYSTIQYCIVEETYFYYSTGTRE